MARPYSAQGRYRLQYKRPAWKRVWNTSQCALGFHTCKLVDLIQILKCHTLKNIKKTARALYLSCNQSTLNDIRWLGYECALWSVPDPFPSGALILQAITPLRGIGSGHARLIAGNLFNSTTYSYVSLSVIDRLDYICRLSGINPACMHWCV